MTTDVTQGGAANVVVDCVANLLRIRGIPGSNLGPETDYPDLFVGFFSPSMQTPGCYLKVGHDRLLPHRY